jgi:hypothetical protein
MSDKKLGWHASTRKFLGGPVGVAAIQKILRSLSPEMLDDLLFDWAEDLPWAQRKTLRLSEDGSILRFIQEENERLKPIFEQYNRKFGHLLFPSGPRPQRDSGSMHVINRDEGHSVSFSYFDFEPSMARADLYANSLSLYCYSRNVSELSDRCSLAIRVCKKILTNDFFEWGYCCLGDEFDANNMDYSGGGACAVGSNQFSKILPGFYWGSYFGPFLIERIGRSKFDSVPGCDVEHLGHGMLVTNQLPSDAWQSPEYQRNRIAAMEHLGRHFFFEKGKELKGTLFPVDQTAHAVDDTRPKTI